MFLEACVETENLNISASVDKEMEMKGNIALIMPFHCFLLSACGLLCIYFLMSSIFETQCSI